MPALILLVATLGVLAGCAEPAPPPPPDPLAGLPALTDLPADGWTRVVAGAQTTCSDGSEYSFFVRPADPAKLLVYLQGGGACWNGASCDVAGQPSYRPVVGDTDPAAMSGIFDLASAENPFADYTMVFAPYCTGDVHLGARVAVYEVPAATAAEGAPGADGGEGAATETAAAARTITIQHQGHRNVDRVLAWTYRNVTTPQTVFVTGSSAGAIPSPHFAVHIAEQYPQARVTQLGDGAGGYRRSSGSDSPHVMWGTLEMLGAEESTYAAMSVEEFNYERLYIEAASKHPEITFARYDTAEDATQLRFLTMSGNSSDSLLPLLDANQADITSKVKNFAAMIAGGDVHTVLGRPEFFTYRVGATRVRDWVAALASGEPVETVRCVACAAPELVEGVITAATGN